MTRKKLVKYVYFPNAYYEESMYAETNQTKLN